MARLEAQAVAGFYEFLPEYIERVASLIDGKPAHVGKPHEWRKGQFEYGKYIFMDPCAGESRAIISFARNIIGPDLRNCNPRILFHTVEMEKERYEQGKFNMSGATDTSGYYNDNKMLHGDAFTVEFQTGDNYGKSNGANVLLLNPPYEHDKFWGRVEFKWLERFTPALISGEGLLLFVVPFHALGVCSEYLAKHYEDIRVFKFPEPDFTSYFKQVVLIGKRRSNPALFTEEAANIKILNYSLEPEAIPVLPEIGSTMPYYQLIQGSEQAGFTSFEIKPLDIKGLKNGVRPFLVGGTKLTKKAVKNKSDSTTQSSDKAHKSNSRKPVNRWEDGLVPIDELGLNMSVLDYLGKPFPVAMPPRDAHVAQALASGAFNGFEIEPDNLESGLPAIIIRGVFEKSLITVEEKRDKKGKLVSEIKIQAPSLKVNLMDMTTCTHHDLLSGSIPSSARQVREFNIADLMLHYGKSLYALMLQQFPAMHNPTDPGCQLTLPRFARELYPFQHQIVQAGIKQMATLGDALVLGEVGTGKSTIACYIIGAMNQANFQNTKQKLFDLGIDPDSPEYIKSSSKKFRVIEKPLILCPPHLLKSWTDQIGFTLPGARVIVIRDVQDTRRLTAKDLINFDRQDEKYSGIQISQLNEVEEKARNYRRKSHLPGYGMTFYILSRETAKLGHKYRSGVWSRKFEFNNSEFEMRICPKCGMGIDSTDKSITDNHRKCKNLIRKPGNKAGKMAVELARHLVVSNPEDSNVAGLVTERYLTWKRQRQIQSIRLAVQDRLKQETKTYGNSKSDVDEVENQVKRELWQSRTNPEGKSFRDGAPILGLLNKMGLQVEESLRILVKHDKANNYTGNGKGSELTRFVRAFIHLVLSTRTDIDTENIYKVIERLYKFSMEVKHEVKDSEGRVTSTHNATQHYGEGQELRNLLAHLLITVGVPGNPEQLKLLDKLRDLDSDAFSSFDSTLKRLQSEYGESKRVMAGTPVEVIKLERQTRNNSYSYYDWAHIKVNLLTGLVDDSNFDTGSSKNAIEALKLLIELGNFKDGEICGESLYQADALSRNYEIGYDHNEPLNSDGTRDNKARRSSGRIPLAKYIVRFCPDLFDLLVADEIHEFNNAVKGSAQGAAFQRLAGLGYNIIGLTGSLMGGYADSLFSVAYALFDSFRQEYSYDQLEDFVRTYGYLKVEVFKGDDDKGGEILSYGKQSERKEIREGKMVKKGLAPGVRDLFTLNYLLKYALFIHKSDLPQALPPLSEKPITIVPDSNDEMGWQMYNVVRNAIKIVFEQIKKDMFTERMGQLYGAFGEMRAAFDLCHQETGNCEIVDEEGNKKRAYQVRYPDYFDEKNQVWKKGKLVVEIPLFPNSFITPKEKWALAKMKEEFGKGRNPMLYLRHTGKEGNLVKRWQRLIKENLEIDAIFLDSKKVDTGIREEWLDKEVMGKGYRVLIANPETIKTGLNNLVYFKTAIWYEGEPNVNAYTYRQANGRLHRIGQHDSVEIYCLAYEDTPQSIALDLLARKVSASEQVDGVSIEGALEAAGAAAEDEGAYLQKSSSTNIGKAIAMQIMSQMGESGSDAFKALSGTSSR